MEIEVDNTTKSISLHLLECQIIFKKKKKKKKLGISFIIMEILWCHVT
jgi:hypothetical protein